MNLVKVFVRFRGIKGVHFVEVAGNLTNPTLAAEALEKDRGLEVLGSCLVPRSAS